MKVGDLVRIVGTMSGPDVVGVVIGPWKDVPEWCRVLVKDEIIQWPESQLDLLKDFPKKSRSD